MDLLYLSDYQLRRRPQQGTPCTLTWEQFGEWLSEPVWGAGKNDEGGWSPGRYLDNIRHLDRLLKIGAVVFDVDINGDVERVATALNAYSCIVHETYSSTPSSPRCRLILQLREPIDGVLYSRAHQLLCMQLKRLHVWPDENAKDASRLSYSPVRQEGAGYAFRVVKGQPTDGQGLVRSFMNMPVSAPIRTTKHPHDKGTLERKVTKSYLESAILSAQQNIREATEGGRHASILKETWGLARPELGLEYEAILEALLPVAVSKMGMHRTHEARSAIRDAFSRRRTRT